MDNFFLGWSIDSTHKNSCDINWALQPVIEDIKLMLKSFLSFDFIFVHRIVKFHCSQSRHGLTLLAEVVFKFIKKFNLTCWKLGRQVVFFIDVLMRKQ